MYRHDAPARLSHWTHGIGTAVCLASGIVLGLRFTPAFVEDGPAAILWQNVHFAAAIVFLFGTFYYLGNTIISKWRLREHLPTKNVVAYTVRHYGLLVGIKKFTMPPEDKYFESEKAAYVMAVVTAALLVVTGLVKALAHVVLTLPDGLMNVMFWVHDIAAALMLLFLAAHVFFAVIAPFSWNSIVSNTMRSISKRGRDLVSNSTRLISPPSIPAVRQAAATACECAVVFENLKQPVSVETPI